jgi:large subunit ribosomal protein L25
MVTLKATPRTKKENGTVRASGKLPAVMYGRKQESQALTIDAVQFKKVWSEAGESTVFTLNDGNEDHDALIHDVQVHPVTEEPLHVDFYIVEKGQVVTVNVPLEFVGIAPIEDQGGFQVMKILHEIEIEAKPKDLPHSIEVDISHMNSEDSQIAVKDLTLPSGVAATADPDEVVATVSATVEEVEETPAEDVDLSAIEVEKKGKEEEAQEAEE